MKGLIRIEKKTSIKHFFFCPFSKFFIKFGFHEKGYSCSFYLLSMNDLHFAIITHKNMYYLKKSFGGFFSKIHFTRRRKFFQVWKSISHMNYTFEKTYCNSIEKMFTFSQCPDSAFKSMPVLPTFAFEFTIIVIF